MSDQKNENIELVFLPSERAQQQIEEAGVSEEVEKFVAKLDDLAAWFKSFKIDSIELSIEGALKTGEILQLFVSAEGKAGCKIVLKPKTDDTTNKTQLNA